MLAPPYQTKKTHPHTYTRPIDSRQVASIILGGGEGSRLHPLTLYRSKPAMNYGGQYRLIDIPISNAIHSNCHKIFILTQFLSSSLHHHLFQTYMQGGFASHLIEILTAEQKPLQKSWFQGTADAVRQNIDYLLEIPVDYYLILSGDQIYNINFQEMFSFAAKTDADVVVAALPVDKAEAHRMGILQVDSNDFITQFYEKPQDDTILDTLKSAPEVLERAAIPPSSDRQYLGSMGIYLFKRKALVDLLYNDPRADFGKHLIPTQVQKKNTIAAYLYDGYWEDIGTISSFYEANIALTKPSPSFQLYHPTQPLFFFRHNLPPAKVFQAEINQSILCEGVVTEATHLSNSILGPRSVVQSGTVISNSYIMGNDYYVSTMRDHHRLPLEPKIGKNCVLNKVIIDKNVAIGNNVQLINKNKLTSYETENLFVRDGIIVVPRGATLPSGFVF